MFADGIRDGGFNLPPGVTISDIPGNRPIDVEYDYVVEQELTAEIAELVIVDEKACEYCVEFAVWESCRTCGGTGVQDGHDCNTCGGQGAVFLMCRKGVMRANLELNPDADFLDCPEIQEWADVRAQERLVDSYDRER